MKRVLFAAIALVLLAPAMMSYKKVKKEPVPAAAPEATEIKWLDINELQAKMAQSPRKVYIDVYTGWCGWCKKMEASTFHNPDLVRYLNNNFYCMRLDAERQDTINFQGKKYFYNPQYKVNTLALELLKGKLSYPTSVLMMENFQNPQPIPGYLDVKQAEVILSYFGDNAFKHQPWEEYQKSYHPSWDHGAAPDNTPPPGH